MGRHNRGRHAAPAYVSPVWSVVILGMVFLVALIGGMNYTVTPAVDTAATSGPTSSSSSTPDRPQVTPGAPLMTTQPLDPSPVAQAPTQAPRKAATKNSGGTWWAASSGNKNSGASSGAVSAQPGSEPSPTKSSDPGPVNVEPTPEPDPTTTPDPVQTDPPVVTIDPCETVIIDGVCQIVDIDPVVTLP